MYPFRSEVNLTPTSTAVVSPPSGRVGAAAVPQMLHGQTPGGGSEATPVPVMGMSCGLPKPLSVRVRLALRKPVAMGVKVTLMVQLAPAGKLPPQVLVC